MNIECHLFLLYQLAHIRQYVRRYVPLWAISGIGTRVGPAAHPRVLESQPVLLEREDVECGFELVSIRIEVRYLASPDHPAPYGHIGERAVWCGGTDCAVRSSCQPRASPP